MWGKYVVVLLLSDRGRASAKRNRERVYDRGKQEALEHEDKSVSSKFKESALKGSAREQESLY
jgi:hypothetical protein